MSAGPEGGEMMVGGEAESGKEKAKRERWRKSIGERNRDAGRMRGRERKRKGVYPSSTSSCRSAASALPECCARTRSGV